MPRAPAWGNIRFAPQTEKVTTSPETVALPPSSHASGGTKDGVTGERTDASSLTSAQSAISLENDYLTRKTNVRPRGLANKRYLSNKSYKNFISPFSHILNYLDREHMSFPLNTVKNELVKIIEEEYQSFFLPALEDMKWLADDYASQRPSDIELTNDFLLKHNEKAVQFQREKTQVKNSYKFAEIYHLFKYKSWFSYPGFEIHPSNIAIVSIDLTTTNLECMIKQYSQIEKHGIGSKNVQCQK